MNKKLKTKIRKLKEDNRKLKNKNKELNEFNMKKLNGYCVTLNYEEEQKKKLVENSLKLLIKRYYGRIEHTHTRIEIDAREIEAMNQYKLEVEKNPFHQTLEIIVR